MKTTKKTTRRSQRKPRPAPKRRRHKNVLQTLGAAIDKITASIPPEAWDVLPRDLSKNVDHYLYGSPKQEPD